MCGGEWCELRNCWRLRKYKKVLGLQVKLVGWFLDLNDFQHYVLLRFQLLLCGFAHYFGKNAQNALWILSCFHQFCYTGDNNKMSKYNESLETNDGNDDMFKKTNGAS